MPKNNTDVKQRIIDAATNVFLEKGYDEARISHIARKAKVSPATIYSHFTGKKDLFDRLNIPQVQNLRPEYDRKRNQILKIALELFGEKGFSGTTIQRIAKRSGYSNAGIYQYFNSKEELFAAVMKETSFHFDMTNTGILEKDINVDIAIMHIGRAYIKMLSEPDRIAFTRTIISDSAKYPEVGNMYHKQGVGYVASCVEECLKKYLEPDELLDLDLTLAAKTYVGSLLSFAIMYKIVVGVDRHFTDEEIVRTSTTIFLNGIRKRK